VAKLITSKFEKMIMRKIHVGLILMLIGFGLMYYGLSIIPVVGGLGPIPFFWLPFLFTTPAGFTFDLGILFVVIGCAIISGIIGRKLRRWFFSLRD
jgi:hypothetical protein